MEATTNHNFPESLRYRWTLEIAQAIEYIHSEGIVHGLIQASNCLLDYSLSAKVCMILSSFFPPIIKTIHSFGISFKFKLKQNWCNTSIDTGV